MKKKVLNIAVCILLIVSLIFNAVQFSENQQLNQRYSAAFQREVSFTVQRLEGYKESQDEAEYNTALSHIYCAYTQLAMMDEELPIVQNAMSFHDLWNKGLFYPEDFKEDLDEMIDAMKLILADSNFDDPNAAVALKKF